MCEQTALSARHSLNTWLCSHDKYPTIQALTFLFWRTNKILRCTFSQCCFTSFVFCCIWLHTLWSTVLCSELVNLCKTVYYNSHFVSATVCHSVYQQTHERQIFDLFVPQVVQKLYGGNGLSHILCSFLWAITDIRFFRMVKAKQMFRILVMGCRLIHV